MKLRIKEFREELRLTQSELAEKINNVQRNVSNWENGVNEPDCQTLIKLAEVFDISLDELCGRERAILEQQSVSGVEKQIISFLHKLSDTQKYALLQFLKEVNV